MSDGEILAEAPADAQPYNDRLVAATVACTWLAMGSVTIGLGLLLSVQGASTIPFGPVGIVMVLAPLPASVAVLVLGIVGGMWRQGLDGIMAAVLLALTVCADLMLWPLIAQQTADVVGAIGFTSCFGDSSSCGPAPSDTNLWIGVGIQTLLLALLLVCTAHWMWRLAPQEAQRRAQRMGLIALGLVFAGVLAAVDSNISTTSPLASINDSNGFPSSNGLPSAIASAEAGMTGNGPVVLNNDLGRTVRVVYCPQQNCHGQKAHTMAANATETFTPTISENPDSFVVLDDGAPQCGTAGGLGGGGMMGLSSADAGTCGMDVQTLDVPH